MRWIWKWKKLGFWSSVRVKRLALSIPQLQMWIGFKYWRYSCKVGIREIIWIYRYMFSIIEHSVWQLTYACSHLYLFCFVLFFILFYMFARDPNPGSHEPSPQQCAWTFLSQVTSPILEGLMLFSLGHTGTLRVKSFKPDFLRDSSRWLKHRPATQTAPVDPSCH